MIYYLSGRFQGIRRQLLLLLLLYFSMCVLLSHSDFTMLLVYVHLHSVDETCLVNAPG